MTRVGLLRCGVSLLLAGGGTATAQPATVRVVEAWARPCRAQATCGAYLTLENPGATPVDLVALRTPAAARAELHQTMLHDGQAHMMAHDRVTIPARGRLAMRPGDWHVMLPGARRAFAAGDTITLTLELVPAGAPPQAPRHALTARVAVRAP
jgi:copper(I)-binding protein